MLTATLISRLSDHALDHEYAKIAGNAVSATAIKWLEENVSCDLILPETAKIEENIAILTKYIGNRPIDIAIQEESQRRKKILVADMDSTIIEEECIDELAAEAGVGEHVKAITQRAMNGEITFQDSIKQRMSLLKGIDEKTIIRILKTHINLRQGASELLGTMRKNDGWTALISGGFDVFTNPIAQKAGFHENYANRLVMQQGKTTGELFPPILGPKEKAQILEKIVSRQKLCLTDSIAVGDGANDIEMLKKAGTGVAFHAKPFVINQTKISIKYGDLTALLFLQGYSKSEFVTWNYESDKIEHKT